MRRDVSPLSRNPTPWWGRTPLGWSNAILAPSLKGGRPLQGSARSGSSVGIGRVNARRFPTLSLWLSPPTGGSASRYLVASARDSRGLGIPGGSKVSDLEEGNLQITMTSVVVGDNYPTRIVECQRRVSADARGAIHGEDVDGRRAGGVTAIRHTQVIL